MTFCANCDHPEDQHRVVNETYDRCTKEGCDCDALEVEFNPDDHEDLPW